MPQAVILLTGGREAPYLLDFTRSLNPDVDVKAITSRYRFKEEMAGDLQNVRLISFLSPIIVPLSLIHI